MAERASSNPTVQAAQAVVLPRLAAPQPAPEASGSVAGGPEAPAGGSEAPRAPTGWSPSAWRLGRR